MGASSSKSERGSACATEYTVSYDSESHFQVLTQMWGSKWPEVLPFCLGNVALMLVLTFLDDRFNKHGLEMTTQGHAFIAAVVAFLLISRVNTGLSRYNQARAQLGTMNKAASQLVQYAFVFSADSTDQSSKEWRAELAYRAMILLRTTMAMIDYPSTGIPAWDIAELKGAERRLARASTSLNEECRRRAHGEHSEAEESSRVPVRISYLLKQTVHGHKTRLEHPLAVPHYEMKIMSEVDAFLGGYYGIRKFLTTPVPFPFIQMSRTFLFAYVFTIPFALLSDASSVVAHCFVVFLFTYGFVGLELVAIEMDNPFGEDENDFNNAALAEVAYEDIYMTVLDVDGAAWADRLRFKMHDSKSRHRLSSEQSWLLEDA